MENGWVYFFSVLEQEAKRVGLEYSFVYIVEKSEIYSWVYHLISTKRLIELLKENEPKVWNVQTVSVMSGDEANEILRAFTGLDTSRAVIH